MAHVMYPQKELPAGAGSEPDSHFNPSSQHSQFQHRTSLARPSCQKRTEIGDRCPIDVSNLVASKDACDLRGASPRQATHTGGFARGLGCFAPLSVRVGFAVAIQAPPFRARQPAVVAMVLSSAAVVFAVPVAAPAVAALILLWPTATATTTAASTTAALLRFLCKEPD